MPLIKSKEEALHIANRLLDSWVEDKQDILNNCKINSFWFHECIGKTYNNKKYIKCGTIRFENEEKIKIEGKDYDIFHFWNVLVINDEKIIIDITRLYLNRFVKQPECTYFENQSGIIRSESFDITDIPKKTNWKIIDNIDEIKIEIINKLKKEKKYLENNKDIKFKFI